jgi:G3E family GTPase
LEASFGDLEPAALFGNPGTDLRSVPDFDGQGDAGEAAHEDDVQACCLVFEEQLDWTAFGIWLTMLLQSRGEDVLRVKGLLNVGGSGPLVLNGVQHVVHPPEHLDEWPDEDHRSRIVFIGRGIDTEALEASLAAFNRAARGGQ